MQVKAAVVELTADPEEGEEILEVLLEQQAKETQVDLELTHKAVAVAELAVPVVSHPQVTVHQTIMQMEVESAILVEDMAHLRVVKTPETIMAMAVRVEARSVEIIFVMLGMVTTAEL